MFVKPQTYLIYKTKSLLGKVYIRLTSKPLHERRHQYFLAAVAGERRGENRYFYNALVKYSGSMLWSVLEDGVPGRIAANAREKFHIKAFHSNDHRYGYNGTSGGDAGSRPSKSIWQKMSLSARPGGVSPHQLKNPVVRSDGQVFESIKAAGEALGLTVAQIRYSLKKRTARQGFTFQFVGV